MLCTQNYVEGMKVILEAAASGDPLTSANEWSPLLSVTVDEFQLKVQRPLHSARGHVRGGMGRRPVGQGQWEALRHWGSE